MRNMAYATLIIVVCASCSLRFVKVNEQKKINILEHLEKYNDRVHQVRASADIKGFGVFGGLAHEKADILVLAPHYFYWSLRSFFGPPAIVVASNGSFITMFDFSSGTKSYQRMAVEENNSIEIFNIKIFPPVITALFLQRIPLAGAKDIDIFERNDVIEIKGLVFDDWQFSARFDRNNQTLMEQSFSHKFEHVNYHIKYDDFKNYQGILYPSVMHLSTRNDIKRVKLELSLLNIELNGEPISQDMFYLKAPTKRAP